MRQNVNVGQRYGKLTVESRHASVKGNIVWDCVCDCGQRTRVNSSNLRGGKTTSCGCVRRESAKQRQTRHGMYGTPIYKVWVNMKGRCLNPKNAKYPQYGGRGIKICPEWTASFDAFYADMGDLPTAAHTIERRDVNGDYEPSNCIWATRQVQANNTRRNRYLTYEGRTQTMAAWAAERGIKPSTLRTRLTNGFSLARALGFKEVK